ncbi:hypothetical protein BCR44DRAFT_1069006 [Catenaria anguillulae PL171]|uniref:Uncharacterized protein n=1 Tax=Catenaria anguillulae PL171 TaxID=765915 RepID=A0A1Y2HS75_9FUNG|nr:hypothetical protein BCR44DRAFT_1069006 [Catenaria anguillulae PL171]
MLASSSLSACSCVRHLLHASLVTATTLRMAPESTSTMADDKLAHCVSEGRTAWSESMGEVTREEGVENGGLKAEDEH